MKMTTTFDLECRPTIGDKIKSILYSMVTLIGFASIIFCMAIVGKIDMTPVVLIEYVIVSCASVIFMIVFNSKFKSEESEILANIDPMSTPINCVIRAIRCCNTASYIPFMLARYIWVIYSVLLMIYIVIAETKYENESMFITLALIMFFIMIHFCLMAVQGAIISRLSEIGSSGMHCGLTQEDVEKYIDLEEDYDDAEENIKLCEEILNENKEEVINEEIKDDEINSTPSDQEHDQV